MKTLKKILLALIGIFPLILNADIVKEVKDNEIIIEENVHYEKNVENSCEYFELIDKDNFILSDWIYTFEKPEEKEYREIVKEVGKINFKRNLVNMLIINEFESNTSSVIKVFEIEIRDKNNNVVPYTTNYGLEGQNLNDENLETFVEFNRYVTIHINFETPQIVEDLTIKVIYQKSSQELLGLKFTSQLTAEIFTNAFSKLVTNIDKTCDGNLCTMNITAMEEVMIKEDISFNTVFYKYRDKYYKCYTQTKININDYVKKEDTQIKNEDTQIKNDIKNDVSETIENSYNIPTIKNTNTNSNLLSEIIEEKVPVNVSVPMDEEKSNEILNTINTENDKLAVLTKETKEEKDNIIEIYLLLLVIIVLTIVGVLYTKKVIKSRTK